MAAWAIFRAVPLSWWLLAVAGAWSAFLGYRVDTLKSDLRESEVMLEAYEQARQQAEDKGKAEKERVTKAHAVIVEDITHALETERRNAARLRRESGSLRDATEALRRRVETAAAAGNCAPADAATRVQADVLGQCQQQLAEVAGHADRSSAAGAACERAYDALNALH